MPPSKCPYLNRCSKYTFSNRSIAQIVTDHYRNGIPMGTLGRRSGVGKSALYNIEHRTADLLKDGTNGILTEFRRSPVKHADETTWPNDGRNGYAWGFFTKNTSLYRFRQTKAMRMRNELTGEEYNRESRQTRDEILELIRIPVKDGKLKGFFDLMNEKRDRFFQWVEHPEVEAENNMAERGLRRLVVARKVCYGSQSEKGLRTRETLMSVIDTLAQRNSDPVAKLTEVLDAIARNPKADVNSLLWGRS